jgi:hypothetical protein
MGMSVGAALGNMSEAWWCPAMHVPGETLDGAPFYRMIFTDCAHPGGILVDAHGGRRFVNEATNYNDLGRSLQLFDAARYGDVPAWLVFDAQRFAERPFGGDVVWSLKAGAGRGAAPADRPVPEFMHSAPSIAELAGTIGAPPDALEESVARFNTQMSNGGDADYGRGQFTYDRFAQGQAQPRPMGDGPYYALRVLPGTLGTKGGLRTDATGQVLRPNGTPIGGLFAAGNASASPFGRAYPGPGATIGPGLHLGWSAGRAAAAA